MLSVSPGEVLGLVGPNEAGKTSPFEILRGRYTASVVHDRARMGLAGTRQNPVVPLAMTIAETFRAAR